MMTAQEKTILRDYSDLMNEVKQRLRTVDAFIYQRQDIPQGLLKECCYVQLRMVCELIALGCLIAHSGIKAAQSGYLKKAYAADKIVSELEKLHPNFFPHAVAIEVGPDGKLSALSDAPDGYLTKDELIKLYGLCGAVLHRGNIQRFLSKKPIPNTNRDATATWLRKLMLLLEHHTIVLSGMDRAILCRVGINSRFPTTTLFMVTR